MKIVKMDPTCKIIQWNVQGISKKKDEILKLIKDNGSMIVAIQEKCTHKKFRIPNYNGFNKTGNCNCRSHGGVSFCHESVPHAEVPVRSDMQVVSLFTIFLRKKRHNSGSIK